jgi:hypothetical protein
VSADYWLTYGDVEADEGCRECSEPIPVRIPYRTDHRVGIHSWNVTYNLGTMLRAAGFPPWRDLIGAPAAEVAETLAKVAETLREDPDGFKQYNPDNGWGTYEGAVEFVESFRDGCANHPRATIDGWL